MLEHLTQSLLCRDPEVNNEGVDFSKVVKISKYILFQFVVER